MYVCTYWLNPSSLPVYPGWAECSKILSRTINSPYSSRRLMMMRGPSFRLLWIIPTYSHTFLALICLQRYSSPETRAPRSGIPPYVVSPMGLQFAAARALGATWNLSFMTQFYTDGEGAQAANCYGHISRVNLTDGQAIYMKFQRGLSTEITFMNTGLRGQLVIGPSARTAEAIRIGKVLCIGTHPSRTLHGHIGTSPELYALCLFSCILVACAFDLRISEALRFTDRNRIREHLRVGRAP